jgi:hypothetical protein
MALRLDLLPRANMHVVAVGRAAGRAEQKLMRAAREADL